MAMSHQYERKRIDKMKLERDLAEHRMSEIRKRGSHNGPDSAEYGAAKEVATVKNHLFERRGE